MDTGGFGAVIMLLACGATAAQPSLDVLVSQPPSPAVPDMVSQELTGGQDSEQPVVLLEDFIADGDSVAERIRVFARPTTNVYAIRLRLVELQVSTNQQIQLLVDQTVGASRASIGKSDTSLVGYEFVIEGGQGLRDGARYAIEAVGLLSSPAMGDKPRSWSWVGAQGDGSIYERTDAGLTRIDHAGLAFEVLGTDLSPECLADVNQDGLLSPADFNAWILAYNSADLRADQNGDGLLSPADFNAWIINYNAGC